MPQALARVRRFCRRYDSDDPLGDGLTKTIEAHFSQDAPAVIVRAIVEDGAIVGHGLFSFERWFEKTYFTVLQYEMDVRYPIAAIRADLGLIETWAKARGADGFQILARTPALARTFGRFYDFEQYRVLMRRKFTPSTDAAPRPEEQKPAT